MNARRGRTRGGARAVAVAALLAAVPIVLGDFWLSVLIFAGIFAVGALGLSLLIGSAGQVSLGHAFFMAAGAYVAVELGAQHGLPLLVWLPVAALVGAVAGAGFAPMANRLGGIYLAIATVGLVFVGLHVWANAASFTGGAAGRGGVAPAAIGPFDANDLRLASQVYSRNQSWFWLVWGLVAVAAWAVRNVVRSRTGRAMQALRDDELRAAIIGIDVARTKRAAFALSSALAAASGALYFGYVQYVSPDQWNLLLSVEVVAMVIIGGVTAWWGGAAGAVALGGLPRIVERGIRNLPSLSSVGLSAAQLNQMLLGALIVAFLMFQPGGIAGVWARVWVRLRARPRRRPSPDPATGALEGRSSS